MPSLNHSEMSGDEFAVHNQRRNKTQRTRVNGLSQRSEFCQQALDHKKDPARGDDKPLDQEIKAARKDNAPAETLADLSITIRIQSMPPQKPSKVTKHLPGKEPRLNY